MSLIKGLDFVIVEFLPAFFCRIDSMMITEGVSVLGFSVGITILVIVVGAVLLRV